MSTPRASPNDQTLLPAACCLTVFSCGEREPAPGPLVSADWLKRHRADSGLVILNADRTRAGVDSAHIPGARFVATTQYMTRQGDLITELPPVARLDSLFESLGIGDRSRIVIYGETLPATRLFFTLDYLGVGDRVSILNGGLESWSHAGGATTRDATLLADAEYVNARRRDPGVLLLDARTQQEFEGTVLEEGVSRPGHIPGAVRLDWTETIADGKFRAKGECASSSPRREQLRTRRSSPTAGWEAAPARYTRGATPGVHSPPLRRLDERLGHALNPES